MKADRRRFSMRTLLAVLVVGVGVGTALADKPTAAGHVSDAGKYSVVFPAKPTKVDADKAVATASGNLTVITSKYESGNAVYSVTYTDYPESFKEVIPSRVLDGVVNGMKGTDGQLLGSETFDVEGGAGRSVTISAGENVVRAKVYLTGRRLYLVQVSGRKDTTKGKAADDFLASFHLTK
jgi:hypothetical protein